MSEEDGQWGLDTVAVLDTRNRAIVMHRRLSPPPVTLTPDMAANVIDAMSRGRPGRTAETMRDAVEEALYLPEFLPGAVRVRGTASGEIWFSGFERQGSLSAWYSVRRTEGPGSVRKILVPSGFTAMDATDTHVWGYRSDDLGVQYVVGLRLLPPAVAEEAGEAAR